LIFGIIGGVGSGKSISATKKIIDSTFHCMVNFNIKYPNVTRIRKDHVIMEEVIDTLKSGKEVKQKKINWDFWNKQLKEKGEYHIFLDECHNLFHSRQAMTKWNTLGSMWISQIRKILGNSERTHIFLISQRIARIDIAFRDLMHGIIYCRKYIDNNNLMKTMVYENGKRRIKMMPIIWIFQYYFIGDDCVDRADNYIFTGMKGLYNYRTGFIANPYFQFYDSYEIFGETGYL